MKLENTNLKMWRIAVVAIHQVKSEIFLKWFCYDKSRILSSLIEQKILKTLFFTFHFVSKDAKTVNTRIDSFWGSPMLSSFAKQSERGSIFGSHQSWCYPYFSNNEKTLCIMKRLESKNLKNQTSHDLAILSISLWNSQ